MAVAKLHSGKQADATITGALTYTELDGSVTTTAAGESLGDGEWGDWDISGTLPSGTVAADIMVQKLGAADLVGVRKDGSGLARSITALKSQILTFPTEVTSTRIVEIMSNDVSDADPFLLVGYWS